MHADVAGSIDLPADSSASPAARRRRPRAHLDLEAQRVGRLRDSPRLHEHLEAKLGITRAARPAGDQVLELDPSLTGSLRDEAQFLRLHLVLPLHLGRRLHPAISVWKQHGLIGQREKLPLVAGVGIGKKSDEQLLPRRQVDPGARIRGLNDHGVRSDAGRRGLAASQRRQQAGPSEKHHFGEQDRGGSWHDGEG